MSFVHFFQKIYQILKNNLPGTACPSTLTFSVFISAQLDENYENSMVLPPNHRHLKPALWVSLRSLIRLILTGITADMIPTEKNTCRRYHFV